MIKCNLGYNDPFLILCGDTLFVALNSVSGEVTRSMINMRGQRNTPPRRSGSSIVFVKFDNGPYFGKVSDLEAPTQSNSNYAEIIRRTCRLKSIGCTVQRFLLHNSI